MIEINTARYEFEQQSSNFEERLALQCNAIQCNAMTYVFIFERLHYTKNTKNVAVLISL